MNKHTYKKIVFIQASCLVFVMVVAPVEFKWNLSLFAMMSTLTVLAWPRFKNVVKKMDMRKKNEINQ